MTSKKIDKIGVLGSGIVGKVLAEGFLRHGFAVMRGSRDPARLASWQQDAGPRAAIGDMAATAAFGDMVVLAVKGTAAAAAVGLCGEALSGKVVIDATNPIADEPPQGGVLRFFTGPNESLMEQLQRLAPAARFVKAFSCVGHAHMVQPDFGGLRPTMFICGDDEDARRQVSAVLEVFGWEVEDMGGAVAARAIEPLCMLWCIPGLLRGQWNHAFKLLRR